MVANGIQAAYYETCTLSGICYALLPTKTATLAYTEEPQLQHSEPAPSPQEYIIYFRTTGSLNITPEYQYRYSLSSAYSQLQIFSYY